MPRKKADNNFLIMKIAIMASRTLPHIKIEEYLKYIPDTIVTCKAGPQTFAIDFAHRHALRLILYFPNYEKYGSNAPIFSSKLVVEECDCLLAFWDGRSRGTKFTIDYAKAKGKPVKVVEI